MMFAQIIEEIRLVVETYKQDVLSKEAFIASHGGGKYGKNPKSVRDTLYKADQQRAAAHNKRASERAVARREGKPVPSKLPGQS